MHARVPFGFNEWVPTPRKDHRYLIEKMPPAELGRAIEDLMMRPPRSAAANAIGTRIPQKKSFTPIWTFRGK